MGMLASSGSWAQHFTSSRNVSGLKGVPSPFFARSSDRWQLLLSAEPTPNLPGTLPSVACSILCRLLLTISNFTPDHCKLSAFGIAPPDQLDKRDQSSLHPLFFGPSAKQKDVKNLADRLIFFAIRPRTSCVIYPDVLGSPDPEWRDVDAVVSAFNHLKAIAKRCGRATGVFTR